MGIAKRILLFVAANFLIMVSVGLIINLLGIDTYAASTGRDYYGLLLWCAVFGFTGSIFSLLTSRWVAKSLYGVRVIAAATVDPSEIWLVHKVHDIVRRAGITTMPEVGIYQSPEVNAFATGPSKNAALVAVSSGLLERMDRNEIEGVLAHEVSHIQNGDMVTMTLLQGLANTFVLFLSRTAGILSRSFARDEDQAAIFQMIVSLVLNVVFNLLAMMVIAGFSRTREFRADAGSARLVGKDKMIGALTALKRYVALEDEADVQPALATMKISDNRRGWLELFSTHPSLERRIRALAEIR